MQNIFGDYLFKTFKIINVAYKQNITVIKCRLILV